MSSFCKVCFEAGKEESVYKSHFVRSSRDAKSKVVCPTLLSTKCNYCKEAGHTIKYCLVLKKKEKMTRRLSRSSFVIEKKDMVMKKEKKNNMFDSLYDSEEEEEEEEMEKISSKGVLSGWAAVVAKPAQRVASLPIKAEECVAIAPASASASASMKTNVSVRVTKSWCEMMDEDSDEDEW